MRSVEKMKNLLNEVLLFVNELRDQSLNPLEIAGIPPEEIQEYLKPGNVFTLDKITRFFEFVPILDQIRRLNVDYSTIELLIGSL